MKRFILETLGVMVALYVVGFMFVMVCVVQGYQGGDMLTEHYRHVLQGIVKVL